MNNLTELAFILDQSSSMHGLEAETLSGYNSMLDKQKLMYAPCRVSTFLFDNTTRIIHDRADIKQVPRMKAEQYRPQGYTALLDAVGLAIDRIGYTQKYTPPQQRAESVMVVIITDGMENASRHYSLPRIRHMIEHQRKNFGWEFIFLGANIDAVNTASSYGIHPDCASDYIADSQGTQLSFDAVADVVSSFRRKEADFARQLDRVRHDQRQRVGH